VARHEPLSARERQRLAALPALIAQTAAEIAPTTPGSPEEAAVRRRVYALLHEQQRLFDRLLGLDGTGDEREEGNV
jgi:hypothetical protein